MTRKISEREWDKAFLDSRLVIPAIKSDFVGRTVLLENSDRIMTMRIKYMEGGKVWVSQ